MSHTNLHNFPPQPTPFIGREAEIAEIVALLEKPDCRLLTILAPGGMGKTRLSFEVAGTQAGQFREGVYYVPLAPLSSPNDIVTTIAESIGFVFFGEETPLQQVVNFLKEREMFLVLDNFEHLLEGAHIVTEIIQGAPQVKLLVTSRERLKLRNEIVYHLRGLDFPTWETPEDALRYDAVKLFMQSAKRARSDFELQTDELDYLARICRLTAGMPLGIELAAGWVDVLSLEQIATEIQRGIDILETDIRDVPERHRSVRATFEYTWERLTEDEQKIFAQLSVFRGGFSLDAAEIVTGANHRHLRKLRQKALVYSEPHNRYIIHELLLQYCAGKLETMGERETIRAKHAAYYADFMAERKQDMKFNGRQPESLELIDPDFENVRQAWLYLVDHEQWDELPKFLFGLGFYCDFRSRSRDGIDLFEYAVDKLQHAPDLSDEHFAMGRIKAWMGWLYYVIGFQDKALTISQETLQILELHDISEEIIVAYNTMILIRIFTGEYAAGYPIGEKPLAVAKELNDAYWEAICLLILHSTFNTDTDIDKEKWSQVRSQVEVLKNHDGLISAYNMEAWMLFHKKKFQEAKQFRLKSLRLAEQLHSISHMADAIQLLGAIALYQSNYTEAHSYLKQALRLFWDAGYTHDSPTSLIRLAHLMLALGQIEKSAEIISVLSRQPKIMNPYIRVNTYNEILSQLRTQMSKAQLDSIWERGKQRELGDLVRELLAEETVEKFTTPKPVSQPLAEPLSERELEVLALMSEGLTNPQIGERLYISSGTVRVHARNIYGKLNVSNRTEAASKARDLNLI